ncbi:MAG: hypothetical protein AB1422_08140 [bacterium]
MRLDILVVYVARALTVQPCLSDGTILTQNSNVKTQNLISKP